MERIKISRKTDFSKLYYHLRNNSFSNQDITLDLADVSFLEPLDIIILVLFGITFVGKGCNINLILPLNHAVASYLQDISFADFCNLNYQQPTTIYSISRRTAMPIRRISPPTMTDYITRAKDYFSFQLPNMDLGLLNLVVSELINNVAEHASSPIDAYVFSQFYPRMKILKVVVADLGIGIPVSVNNFMRQRQTSVLSDLDALQWAVSVNTSVKSTPRNSGKGLYNLMAFSDNGQSTIKILSNQAFFTASNKKHECTLNPILNFMGTVIEVSIFTDNLDPLSGAGSSIDL